jgi:uncharacterized protein (AIM24 family)
MHWDLLVETKMNGVSSAFNRVLTGQNIFVTNFRYDGSVGTTGTVCLGTAFPSKILRMTLNDHPNRNLICQKGAFLASNPNVLIEMEFTKSMTAGFFGGEGFILQKISGDTDILIKGGGTIVCKELKDGETLRVTSGSLVCFESTVSYDVQMMTGVTNALFSGEGLFITTLQGPGQVWLQGMPPDRMIAEIASRVPRGGLGFGVPIPIPLGGGAGVGAGSGDATDAVTSGVPVDVISSGAATAAASDAAMEADRAATVATSGIDSSSNIDAESSSALFGDTVSSSNNPISTESMTDLNSPSEEQAIFDDNSSFFTESNEPTFEDDFSTEEPTGSNNISDGELFEDSVSENVAENVTEEGQSIFRKLWDFFSDQE